MVLPDFFGEKKGENLSHLLFIGQRTQLLEGAMSANAVVKTLAVLKDGLSGLCPGLKRAMLNAFPFECAQEALHGGMIVAVPDA